MSIKYQYYLIGSLFMAFGIGPMFDTKGGTYRDYAVMETWQYRIYGVILMASGVVMVLKGFKHGE